MKDEKMGKSKYIFFTYFFFLLKMKQHHQSKKKFSEEVIVYLVRQSHCSTYHQTTSRKLMTLGCSQYQTCYCHAQGATPSTDFPSASSTLET